MSFARKLQRRQNEILRKEGRTNKPYWYVRDMVYGEWKIHQHKNFFVSIFYKEQFVVCVEYNRPLNNPQLKAFLFKYQEDPHSFDKFVREQGTPINELKIDMRSNKHVQNSPQYVRKAPSNAEYSSIEDLSVLEP